jgi:UDP-N-acetylmuramate: L-alanyl-gamma-D-glutamyl-meso-diaminopimelate ligase
MHIHILGICGTFMGGLAALAREAGHKVTGCDTGVYPPMSDQLRGLGIELIEGFGADQLALAPDVFVVGNVVSRARLADGNARFPLMEAILNSGLPYTSGPQWLAEHVLQGRHVLAVAGTHGKTTTTAMLTWILECAGLKPGFLIGGVPLNFGLSARLGASISPLSKQGPRNRLSRAAGVSAPSGLKPAATNLLEQVWTGDRSQDSGERWPASCSEPHEVGSVGATFIIEADEYDTAFFDKRSKFVHYRPRTAVLNNLEFDHADIFENLAAIERQFHHLVRTVPSTGRVVVNAAEASLHRVIAQGCWSERVLFGNSPANTEGFTAHGEPHDFEVRKAGLVVARVQWGISGMHNQCNALAAMAAAEHVGVSPEVAAHALASFQNVKRRMEVRGVVHALGGDITVYDDFAHHPTAMHTTVDGLRRQLNSTGRTADRILAIFEPRSNTMKLGTMTAQLPRSLESADIAFCHAGGLDWDAREALAPMVDRAHVADTIAELVAQVKAAVRPGDHLLCMSNGGFGGVQSQLLEVLKA